MSDEPAPIVYTARPGCGPERSDAVPFAGEIHRWLLKNGLRAAWVMIDEGTHEQPPEPCCYELERNFLG